MRKTTLVAILLASVATSPAGAQTLLEKLIGSLKRPRSTTPASPQSSVASVSPTQTEAVSFNLDIAGVRLGMTPEMAKTALTNAGYRPTGSNWLSYQPSFASRVRQTAERQRTGTYKSAAATDQIVSKIEAIGPNREDIEVYLDAVSKGSSIVTGVRLSISSDVMTGPALVRQAIAKYGRPDGQYDAGMTTAWCPAPVKSVCGALAPFGTNYNSLPNLVVSTLLSSRSVKLSEGTERSRRREREVEAAIERAAPKTDRVAF